MYFERLIDRDLEEWKAAPLRKPLLLRGARQVGKSSSVRRLGESFKYFLEVNFERDRDVKSLFEGNLQPREIAARLSAYFGIPAIPGETLLFFDEIQQCPEALRSLWFFKEDYPDLHVIAAGSLLEFALKGMTSYGVGRIRSMFMHPMSFDEFLNATGNQSWLESKRKASSEQPLFEALHKKLTECYRTFLLVGGMPAAVRTWVETKDYLATQSEHADLLRAYFDDFSKYAKYSETDVLRHTLISVGNQMGGKFVYSRVGQGYRTEKIRNALDLLTDAGLLTPVMMTAANGLPLGAEEKPKFRKYLFIDTAILLQLLGQGDFASMTPRDLLQTEASELVNRGSLAEMSFGLELLKYASSASCHNLYYWENTAKNATAEVDYLIVRSGKIVPIEVKSGSIGKMKSLRYFMDLKGIDRGIRCSMENFGRIGNIDIYPLYAVSNIFAHT